MASTGKKINELTAISTLTNETVLPGVYVESGAANSTANKISVQQISAKVQNDMTSTLADKQDKLTAGTNISIENNVISSTSSGISFADLVPNTETYTTLTRNEKFVAPSQGWIVPITTGSSDTDVYICVNKNSTFYPAASAGGVAFVNTGDSVWVKGVNSWEVRFIPCVGA